MNLPSPPILYVAPGFRLGHPGLSPFLEVPSFTLPRPGTYTLEGPNGSGKSMFTRFLTGTLPGGVDRTGAPTIEVDGKPIAMQEYGNALAAGIVAVFQDDDMISSMSILEYLHLRHGRLSPREIFSYAWGVLYHSTAEYAVYAARILGPSCSDWIRERIEHIEPKDAGYQRRKAIRDAAIKLLEQHGVPATILNEPPTKLSGGAKASAKLVAAQLHSNTRLLVLDEPFNSVERTIWPRFAESIKQWAKDSKAAVLAISHNPDELSRWEPEMRFEIRDGVLTLAETFKFGVKRRIADARTNPVPIYEFHTGTDDEKSQIWKDIWDRLAPRKCIILAEESLRDSAILQEVLSHVPPGVQAYPLLLAANQLRATTDSFAGLCRAIAAAQPTQRTVFAVLGGTQLRVLASFAALNSAHVDGAKILIVPSSFVDGIKAIVENTVQIVMPPAKPDSSDTLLTAVFSPDAFALNLHSLQQRAENYRPGLVLCVRLGLLFDAELFCRAADAIGQAQVDASKVIDVYHRAVVAVNELVEIGPYSSGVARILKFGHDHARCLDQLTSGGLPEGQTLLIGMILECILVGNNDLASELSKVHKAWGVTLPSILLDDTKFGEINRCYIEFGCATKTRDDYHINCLHILMPGQFRLARLRDQLAAAAATAVGRFNRSIPRFASDIAESALRPVSFGELGSSVMRLRQLCKGN